MGIQSMVEEAFGFVTDQDREVLHSYQKKIAAEKQAAQQGTPATMMNSGVGVMIDMAQHMVQSQMTGETTAAATARRENRSRIVQTIETRRQDADELEAKGIEF